MLLAKDGVHESWRNWALSRLAPFPVCRESPAAARERFKPNTCETTPKKLGASNPLPPAVLEGTRDQRDANSKKAVRGEKGHFRPRDRSKCRLGWASSAAARVSLGLTLLFQQAPSNRLFR